MIKAGLSKSAAFAALTTNPAKILGLSDVGTIASGKMANIFISDKPYFDKDSKIKYTFIEGQLKEIEHKKESNKKSGEVDKEMIKSIVGSWKYEVTTPDGNYEGDIKIDGAESIESITITSEGEENEGEDIELDGKSLGFSFDTNIQGMAVTINMTLEFSDDSFTGDASVGEFGTFPIKGNKSSSPE